MSPYLGTLSSTMIAPAYVHTSTCQQSTQPFYFNGSYFLGAPLERPAISMPLSSIVWNKAYMPTAYSCKDWRLQLLLPVLTPSQGAEHLISYRRGSWLCVCQSICQNLFQSLWTGTREHPLLPSFGRSTRSYDKSTFRNHPLHASVERNKKQDKTKAVASFPIIM
jgi:hypothetical protein